MVKKLQHTKSLLKFLKNGFLTVVCLTATNAAAQYCTPTFGYGCSDGDEINNFYLTGNGLSFSNTNTGCSPNAYGDFTLQTINVTVGNTYSFFINHGSGTQRVRIWVDFNNNHIFDENELLTTSQSTGNENNSTTNGSFSIPEHVASGSYRMRIATRYNQQPIPCNTDGYGEAEDYTLVVTNNSSCLSIATATSSAITANSATINWANTTGANEYIINYGTTGFDVETGQSITVATNTANLTNLSPNTSYQYYVKSVCGSDYSTWAGPYQFTTLHSCPPPTNLSATITDVTTANLTWQFSGGGNNFVVEYGETGLTIGNGTVVNATTNSVQLTGLLPATTYQYYVKEICSNTDSSVYAGPFSFNTPIQPVPTPWTENFSSLTTPLGWNNQDITLSNTATPFGNTQGYYLRKNAYNGSNSTATGVVITRPVGPVNANDYLSFKHATNKYGTNRIVSGNIQVQISTDFGATYETIHTINHTEDIPWTEIEPLSLANYSGQIVVVKIAITTNSGQSVDYYLGLDDFSIYPISACPEPTQASYTINNLSSVTLTWNSTTANNFKLAYGPQGFDYTTVTPINVTGTNYIINGLTENTNYQYYIKSICPDGESTWIGPINFKASYCESIPTSIDGNGITSVTIGETTFPVTNVTQYTHPTTINVIKAVETASSITFATGYTYHTHIWVDLDKNGIFDNDTEKLYSGESINTTPATLTTNFTIPAGTESGEYRFRIGTADNGQATPNPCYSETYGVTIDGTLNITDALSNETLDLTEVKLYPNPTSDVLNIAYKNEVAKVTIFDIQGRQVATHNINATNTTINVGDLATGTYLIKLETATNEVSTLKFIKK